MENANIPPGSIKRGKRQRRTRSHILDGFLWAFLLQWICSAFLLFMGPSISSILGIGLSGDTYFWPLAVLMYGGVTQFLYLVPAAIIARRKGCSNDYLKGMALAAALFFLLNACCLGVM